MYISRSIEKNIIKHLQRREEIIIVYGARQVGKSTLINHILDKSELRSLRIAGEELKYQSIFSSQNLNAMLEVVEGYDVLFIDEAQNINNIGINIKLLFDYKKNLKIILSGSSSFELASRVAEPLTGRTKTYLLYTFGYEEISTLYNTYELKEHLRQYLIFGGYPKLYHLTDKKDKIAALIELASSYLYKDILMFNNLRNPQMLYDLLRLLAFQLGNPVSINELANKLKTSSETVDRYLNLLEQSFVIFRLSAYAKNLRKEISKMDKIYFFDVGIRNAIIENFDSISNRFDHGPLWENFLVTERIKKNRYNESHKRSYYWRTYSGVELDYIEAWDDNLVGFEFKWNNKLRNAPITWKKSYSDAQYQLVNRENFLEFVL